MTPQKVYVGMSGGVDSSVSALLLKEQGFDVTGVFIKTWHPDFLTCSWIQDRRDAMAVASKLGIPFRTLDLEDIYRTQIVSYMIDSYRHGRTPNPDVMCNQIIKFGHFLDFARKHGVPYIATGHYAQNVFNDETERHELHEGADPQKAQAYFLWKLNQEHLQHTLFPVGHMQKSEVRELATEYGLTTAAKKDSQGLCFLGKVDMKEFLKRYIDEKPGLVVNEEGQEVGRHQGAAFFTIGQRQGFEITEKTPQRKPYYITGKDMERNLLVVSHTPQASVHNPQTVALHEANYVSGEAPPTGEYDIRIRYRQPLQRAHIDFSPEHPRVTFNEAQSGVARGQSLVIYVGEQCLGGGIMEYGDGR